MRAAKTVITLQDSDRRVEKVCVCVRKRDIDREAVINRESEREGGVGWGGVGVRCRPSPPGCHV